jgi:hypothetical protein
MVGQICLNTCGNRVEVTHTSLLVCYTCICLTVVFSFIGMFVTLFSDKLLHSKTWLIQNLRDKKSFFNYEEPLIFIIK